MNGQGEGEDSSAEPTIADAIDAMNAVPVADGGPRVTVQTVHPVSISAASRYSGRTLRRAAFPSLSFLVRMSEISNEQSLDFHWSCLLVPISRDREAACTSA